MKCLPDDATVAAFDHFVNFHGFLDNNHYQNNDNSYLHYFASLIMVRCKSGTWNEME